MSNQDNTARQRWMSILARSRPDDLLARWTAAAMTPEFTFLRAPETGLVMTRGRMGGTGDAFNLGEMTVTRCTVQLKGGMIGHAYIGGRNKAHAETAAIIDALMQGPNSALLEEAVIRPLEAVLDAQRISHARKAAATKVDFFTLARTAKPK